MKEKAYKDIIQGLNEAIAYKNGTGKARVQKLSINPVGDFTPSDIKAIRKSLNLSQVNFAIVMGVSTKTVEAWEAGTNIPNGCARRLFHVLQTDPDIVTRCNIIA